MIFFSLKAIQQQKYRELQETERKKRMEELRARENDKFAQVEERRRAIENAERDRRESLLRKNQEREEKIVAKRKAQNSNTHFAFGSCTPRLAYPVTRTDSGSDILATRSPSQLMSQSMYGTNKERRSAERELGNAGGAKRATSAHGLDQDLDGKKTFLLFVFVRKTRLSQSHCLIIAEKCRISAQAFKNSPKWTIFGVFS